MTNRPSKFRYLGTAFILFILPGIASLAQPGSLIVNQDQRVEQLVHNHIKLNEKMLGIPGYRVQVFFASGNDSKDRAYAVKSEVMKSISDLSVHILFEAPYYKVRVGDFRTRLDAERELQHIRLAFPGAFIVEDTIELPPIHNEGF